MKRIEVRVGAKEADEDTEELMGESAEDGGRGFAVGSETEGEGMEERVEALGDESGHIESLAKVGVALAGEVGRPLGLAGLPAPRSHTCPGAEGARIALRSDGRQLGDDDGSSEQADARDGLAATYLFAEAGMIA